MNAIALEVDELVDTVHMAGTARLERPLSDELHEAGWRSPTEVGVALRVLGEGDLPRVAAILRGHGDENIVSTQEACS